MNKEELQAAVDAMPYWYHRIELPYGITTPGWAPLDQGAYRIPADLTGKDVLDVGAWDGYWSFESLKRGARRVVAIDDFSDTCGNVTNADRSSKWKAFDLCREAMGYTSAVCWREDADVYDVPSQVGNFDHIYCFGLIYHLRHPLLALERLKDRCNSGGSIHIETAILDGCKSAYREYGYTGDEHCFEFFPGDEYGRNHSNWWVGTLTAWASLVEAAGFDNIEVWKLTNSPRDVSEARGFIRADVY